MKTVVSLAALLVYASSAAADPLTCNLSEYRQAPGRSFITRFLSIAKATNDPEFPNDLKQLAGILRTLGLNAEAAELERTPVNIPR